MTPIVAIVLGLSLVEARATPLTSLKTRIDGLAARSGGRLGVGIELLETRESLTVDGDRHYPMQSVYKLPIAMAVLAQVDRGLLRLDQRIRVEPAAYLPPGWHSPIRDQFPKGTELSVRELLRWMVSESDGSACDVLLGVAGGPEKVMDYLGGIGVDGIQVVSTEREMSSDDQMQYRNWATPRGTLWLLRALHEGRGLTPASRELLLKDLVESSPGGHRLKALLPAGAVVAHKTGTGKRGTLWSATNDIGLVTLPNGQHLAIGVLLMDSTADEATREATIAAVAKAAWEAFTGH